ncbi:thermonuclease family protein [Chitinophaga pendula]|uniref:thermonuclease family protein n=1 Tax=Chitinophaga TaxID=79328 RepID=UPI0012FDD740|nr:MULTISPECIES: thermonuclease family protein [Chitinophaga]UCJ06757.1 thermonuclease family protein [Chitinophaga pendula]
MLRQLMLVLLFVCTLQPAISQKKKEVQTVKGKVVRIIDGDTFELLVGRTPYRIRMNAIDAPERGQDYYQVSKQALSDQCFNKTMTVKLLKKDMYQRWLGDLYDAKGVYVNAWMVARGYAWQYKYSNDATLAAAQEAARKKHLGLWSQPSPQEPWTFRKVKRNGGAALQVH